MLQFDEYKVKLNNLKPELDELEQALGLEAAQREAEMLESESASDGFWDNLDFRIPQYVTAELLEFLACGDRAIDLREMRARTRFIAVPAETIKMFWKVIDRMTNEQRRLLLQFATGTMSIPHGSQIFLTIDFVKGNDDERMPSSSTCFNKLHLPPFSSVEKMYKAFVTACEYTGTFEMN